jgi:bifunctional DNA-binding transcriptional regulator/antitoxin component of YhaV-PrlF toxin-antitoxin module
LSGVGEVFVARVVAGGKVTIPLLVREVLKIREGDYVRINISEVIKKKQQKEKSKK